jgi:hypothetical protein
METFIKVCKRQKENLVSNLSNFERIIILKSLVRITLAYKISGNLGMFNHVMK